MVIIYYTATYSDMQEGITIYRVSKGVDTEYIVLSIWEDVYTHRQYSGNSIQRPPVIKKAAVEVAFPWHVFTVSDTAVCFSLHPLLAVAVLRVLDILAGMEERSSVEAPIDISGVRNIMPGNDFHQPVVLAKEHLAPILSASFTLGGRREQLFPLLLDSQQGIFYLCFCHIPFHSEQSVSPGKGRSNCHAAWRGIPFAYACSAFAAESSAPCEHILSFVLWVSIFSMKSWHCAG